MSTLINKKTVKDFELTLNIARVAKVFDRKHVKRLNPKQMLQRLPIALTQVKADNTFENLLREIRQIVHSLYLAKEITKKVCNNIMNSTKS